MGKDPKSQHNVAQRCYTNLKNQAQHIETMIIRQTSEQIASNHLRLKTTIDVVRLLTFQGCALRGRDERFESRNRGNFFELIKLLASYDKNVEQMAIVFRFVDKEGFVRERFFDVIHVKDTAALTLKKEICDVLSHHCLNIKDTALHSLRRVSREIENGLRIACIR
ncbi:DUF4371 domain-containing protein [Cephalotus follicularis]|uniref:DUF4371 domain-containing protein n=1 Tax=Cephalotus follicularis TaxID=3775 RepID=A0A1Q3D1T2_CEPFO|nr:DUF4371 domain-containing protein [Cephalotus follicularis]